MKIRKRKEKWMLRKKPHCSLHCEPCFSEFLSSVFWKSVVILKSFSSKSRVLASTCPPPKNFRTWVKCWQIFCHGRKCLEPAFYCQHSRYAQCCMLTTAYNILGLLYFASPKISKLLCKPVPNHIIRCRCRVSPTPGTNFPYYFPISGKKIYDTWNLKEESFILVLVGSILGRLVHSRNCRAEQYGV